MNLKTFWQYFFYSFAILLVTEIQLGALPAMPGVLAYTDVAIIFLLVVLVLYDVTTAFYFGLMLGIIFDVLNFWSFGQAVIGIEVVLVVCYILLTKVFTNRSLYSFLALTLIATVVYWLAIRITDITTGFVFSAPSHLFFNPVALRLLGWKIGLNLITSAITFQIATFISHSLKPVFLMKSNYVNR
ncbi:MAG: hypothetical protein WCK11_00180 [Candidatus Falkowbacteria bacterium]